MTRNLPVTSFMRATLSNVCCKTFYNHLGDSWVMLWEMSGKSWTIPLIRDPIFKTGARKCLGARANWAGNVRALIFERCKDEMGGDHHVKCNVQWPPPICLWQADFNVSFDTSPSNKQYLGVQRYDLVDIYNYSKAITVGAMPRYKVTLWGNAHSLDSYTQSNL